MNKWSNIDKHIVMVMKSGVTSLDCSPDGNHIVCGFYDNMIRIFDPNT